MFLDKEAADALGLVDSAMEVPLLLLILPLREPPYVSVSEAKLRLSLLDKGFGVLLLLVGFIDK